jgi:transcriptional regulator with XRE-family HTH domain
MQRYIHLKIVSMHKINKSLRLSSDAYVKCCVVDKQRPESLADYVRRVRNEKRLSLSEVQRNSQDGINSSYVSRIENGLVTNVTPEKLRALSKGLGVSEDEIFDVARGKAKLNGSDLADDEQVAALFYDYKDLTDEDKQELRAIWEMFREEIRRRKLKPKKKR